MPPQVDNYQGRQLTAGESVDACLPSQLQWFDKRQALFDANHGNPTLYTIAMDAGPKGAKRFSSVEKPEDYLSLIQSIPPNLRCAYEVVNPHVPCKLYLDIETELPFESTPDPNANKIKFDSVYNAAVEELGQYLQQLRSLLRETFGIHPIITTLQSCRLKSKGTILRLSFHCVVVNLFFDNNTKDSLDNAKRKQAIMALIKPSSLPSTLHFACDQKVYSKYQCFRLPLCIKRGEPHGPLVLVPQLCDLYSTITEEQLLLSAILTRPEPNSLIITNAAQYPKLVELGGVILPILKRQRLSTKKGDGRRSPGLSHVPASPNHYSQLCNALQKLLHTTSDTSSQVTTITSLEHEAIGKLKAELRNNGPRICYCQPFRLEIHNSNNAVLFLSLIDDHTYKIKYKCYANSCKTQDRDLGTVYKNANDTWEYHTSTKLVYPIGGSPRPFDGGPRDDSDLDVDDGSRPRSATPSDTFQSDNECDAIEEESGNESDSEEQESEQQDSDDCDDIDDSQHPSSTNTSSLTISGATPESTPESQDMEDMEDMEMDSPMQEVVVEEEDEDMESDGDQTSNDYIRACIREILLTGPFPWDSLEITQIFSMYKRVNPLDNGGALREWARRMENGPTTAQVEARLLTCRASRKNPLTGLHKIRLQNTVLHFMNKSQDPVVKEDEGDDCDTPPTPQTQTQTQTQTQDNFKIQSLMHCIKTGLCTWTCCTRVLKQLWPEEESRVLSFIHIMYRKDVNKIQALWHQQGHCEYDEMLKDFVRISTCNFGLIKEVIPDMNNGAPVKKWGFTDDDRTILVFTLDTVPPITQHLLLTTGVFPDNNNRSIKLKAALFDGLNKDAKLAKLLYKKGKIEDKLRYDQGDETYRLYNPSNGIWEIIEESTAVFWTAKLLGETIMPMYHLQNFREQTDPKFNRKNPVVSPKSVAVKDLLSRYAEKMRNAKDVLNAIKARLVFKFDSNKYPSFLLFKNGLVDLATGRLLGPAGPDMGIIHSVPHNYDPNIDTTKVHEKMMSFWPEQVYPGESDNIARFYQGFKGYSLTGHVNLQKALFLLGKGSNGKSVLNNIDLVALGNDLYKNIGMSAFSQEGSGNNDYLYQIKNCRSANIMENTSSGKINEETFKKATGGDPMSVSAKYKRGVTETFPTKLCFSMNDPPVFSSTNAYAIRRRIWNLNMLAQRLNPDDDQRLILESEGKSHYIMELDNHFLTDFIANDIPAYLTWAVQGAVTYFANGQNIVVPKTIARASMPISSSERTDLFVSFIKDFLIKANPKSIISTSEILEVFFAKEDINTDVDQKTSDELSKLLKLVLTDPKFRISQFDNCKVIRVVFPSRQAKNKDASAYRKAMGYASVAWKPGVIAHVVNHIRGQYTNETRPMISSVSLDVEPEEEEVDMDTAGQS